MGIRETGSYNTGSANDGSASATSLPSRTFSPGRWLGQLRNAMEERNEDSSSSFNRIAGPIARASSQCCNEDFPTFVRGLAAGSRRNLIILVVFLLCAFTVVHYLLQPPGSMVENLVPAPALCSSQNDMYDTATRLCRVGNKYALWYLRHKDWVQCAPNVPGYKILESNGPDWNGQYWYSFAHSSQIREFYDTCIPECATDEDSFHINKDLCMLSDDVLITWLNGDGQQCSPKTVGEKAIKWATASLKDPEGRYWYAPDSADKVRELLESCHGTCAQSDLVLHDSVHCQVMNTMALHYLVKKTGSCDSRLRGFQAISPMGTTKDVLGSYMYPKTMGGAVESFYLSCMEGWDAQRFKGAITHSSETVGGKSLSADAASRKHMQENRRWEEAMMESSIP